jgi:hypothetical protein
MAYGCGQSSSGDCSDNGTCAPAEGGIEGGADVVDGSAGPDAADADASVTTDADASQVDVDVDAAPVTTLDSSVDAEAGDGSDGFACDPTKDPSVEPCVIGDSYGVFVSPTGHTGAKGTMGDPFSTFTDAIAAATGHSDRVLACAGNYDESLVLGAVAGQDGGGAPQEGEAGSDASLQGFSGGVTVYGGLDCSNANQWKYTGTKAILAPSAAGTALTVKGLVAGVTFKDVGFHAVPAIHGGESSIAVFVSESASVTFTRCDFEAGAGLQGVDGTAVAPFASGAPMGQVGAVGNGGASTPNTCGGLAMASVGGAGGPPGPQGANGIDGSPGPSNQGTATGCSMNNTGGGNGANGSNGAGGFGATGWATFDQNGWTPIDGTAGGSGTVGQGGGGGGSADATGGGGGGGAGGCGGAAGLSGTGGGSSVAILVFQSSIDIEQSSIAASNAGRGGNGAGGQAGQAGGGKANGFGGTACSGGKGGNGGSGGGGGGGAGGLSVGVLWTGTAPVIDGSSLGQSATGDAGSMLPTIGQTTVGVAGAGGAAGAAAAAGANPGTVGKDGTAGAVVQFQ